MNPDDTSTKARLCDAAERLVALHGVDGPSTRSICAEAGANSAAVHYHFGTRAALLEAVLERRMHLVRERRNELIASLTTADSPTARDIAHALIAPTASVAHSRAGRYYLGFLFQLATAGPQYRQTSRPAVQHPVRRPDGRAPACRSRGESLDARRTTAPQRRVDADRPLPRRNGPQTSSAPTSLHPRTNRPKKR